MKDFETCSLIVFVLGIWDRSLFEFVKRNDEGNNKKLEKEKANQIVKKKLFSSEKQTDPLPTTVSAVLNEKGPLSNFRNFFGKQEVIQPYSSINNYSK